MPRLSRASRHRGAVALDPHHLAITAEKTREETDPAVRVDERAPIVVVHEHVSHGVDEGGRTVGAGLEERGRGDREAAPVHDLVVSSGATPLDLVRPDEHDVVGDVDASRGRRRQHEPLASLDAAPKGHLARVAEATLVDEVGEERMGHEARVDLDEVVAAVCPVRRSPGLHAHSHRRSVSSRRQRRPGGDHGVGEVTDAAERVFDDLALQVDLHGRIDVLPPAPAATRSHVRAGWRDPARGRLLDRDGCRLGVVHVLVEHLGDHELTRQGPLDEDDAAVVVASDGGTACGHRSRAESEHLWSVRPAAGRNVVSCNPSPLSPRCCPSTRDVSPKV